ncbi:MAG: HDOD domain-containing protein [Granulosicoccus sp.]
MAYKTEQGDAAVTNEKDRVMIAAAASAVSPVGELSAINRAAICKSATIAHVQRNDQLTADNSHRWLIYLVEGSLTLYQGKSEVGVLDAQGTEALQPLFHDKSAYNTARPNALARIVRFGREQLNILLGEQQKNAVRVFDVQVGELDILVFDDIRKEIENDSIRLGCSAVSAARISSTYEQVVGIPELADIIQCDVGLAVQLLDVANRTEAGSNESMSTIRGAITRLGVDETKRQISAMLQANTLTPGTEVIGKCMEHYAYRTSMCVAIVQVLAKQVPRLKPEVATLVALLADIGELMVITYANRYPEKFRDEKALYGVIENLRVILGGWLINTWKFSDEFVDACHMSRDWYRNHGGEITYTDLFTAALLIFQSELKDARQSSIPSANNLLLARRLQQAGIDLTSPGEIFMAANERMCSIRELLKAS